jgi:membrane protease YdiL (CAAX protease family)
MKLNILKPFVEVCRDFEEASARTIGTPEGQRAAFQVTVVSISAAVCLTLAHYYSRDFSILQFVAGRFGGDDAVRWIELRENRNFIRMLWWASIVVLFYLLVPIVVVKAVLRARLRDYGFRLRGAFVDRGVYLVVLAVILPLVWACSAAPGFLRRYPFYTPPITEPLWPRFFVWEVVYLLQFLGVEFFFRGFLLHATKQRFGFYAIWVTTIPYCMIHFGKPIPETIGAIVAGFVLGVFSLKSGSIIPGFLLHCGTALAMDFAALFRKGLLTP